MRTQNPSNTCAFVTIPPIPLESRGGKLVIHMKQAVWDMNNMLMAMNKEYEESKKAPRFMAWGVHDAGYVDKGPITFKHAHWIILDNNPLGSSSKILQQSKITAQGNGCQKFFKVKQDWKNKSLENSLWLSQQPKRKPKGTRKKKVQRNCEHEEELLKAEGKTKTCTAAKTFFQAYRAGEKKKEEMKKEDMFGKRKK